MAGFMGNQLPRECDILRPLYREPRQTPTLAVPFKVEKGGIEFTIEPLFDYDPYGLIVSEHNTQYWTDLYHSKWKDKLNIKDLCVVWGDNFKGDLFRQVKYKSGSWTCYVMPKNLEAAQTFDFEKLSNNHLLVDDPLIKKALSRVRRGDQVHFRGYLAKYSHGEDFTRGSSITRIDRNNGACETVFLKEFEVLEKGNLFWRLCGALLKLMLVIVTVGTLYNFGTKPYDFRKK